MPKVGVFDFLADPSEGTFGSASKISLLKRPAAWKGFGVDQFNKNVDFKNDYLKGISASKVTPTNLPKMNMAGSTTTPSAGPNKAGVPYGTIASGVFKGASDAINAYSDPNASATAKDAAALSGVANTAADTLMSIPTPWTMAIGAAIKGTDILGKSILNKKLDSGLKDFEKNTNKEVVNSSGFAGIGAGAEGIGKDVSDYKNAGLFGKMAYGGGSGIALGLATGGLSTVLGIGGRGKLDAMKRAAEKNMKMQKEASGILKTNTAAKEAAMTGSADIAQRNLQQKYNPDMFNNIQFGRNGIKLRKFQEGGKINIIVNGKLHKELHNLEEKLDLGDAELSRKGIPVVSMEDGGMVTEQHAEVEKNELILTIELTKKLEELESDGSDEAMIEAGKLLAYEIVKNTKDSKDKIIKNA